MEWRSARLQALVLALTVSVAWLINGPSARASGALNPDEHYPVSRFRDTDPGYAYEETRNEEGRGETTRAPASKKQSEPLGRLRRNGVQEVAVIAGDLGFFPRTVFVTRDVPVRMFVTGASKNSLCILMDSFQVRKQVRSQKIEEVAFTPKQPGSFRFYCPINGAEGFVVVRDFERADGG